MTAFGAGRPFTFGVEEEFQLVDPATGELVSRMDEIIGPDDPIRAQGVHSEMFQSAIEIATPVCRDIDEAREALLRLRGMVLDRTEAAGLAIAAAGTHPVALHEDQKVTDDPRYQRLVQEIRWPAKQDLTFGLHVHVAVPSGRAAVAAMNGLHPVLPLLLALSANSPFWRGRKTELNSTRVQVGQAMPRSGLQRSFHSWKELSGVLDQLVSSGATADVTELWWDTRPRPDLGTVEVRICDVQASVEDSLALAALIQAAVARFSTAGYEPAGGQWSASSEVLAENRWRAVRDGAEAKLFQVGPDGGLSQESVPSFLAHVLDDVQPAVSELGLEQEIATLETLADQRTTGASGQLAVYKRTGDLGEVVADVVERTAEASRR